jgi:hypothetical protein
MIELTAEINFIRLTEHFSAEAIFIQLCVDLLKQNILWSSEIFFDFMIRSQSYDRELGTTPRVAKCVLKTKYFFYFEKTP